MQTIVANDGQALDAESVAQRSLAGISSPPFSSFVTRTNHEP